MNQGSPVRPLNTIFLRMIWRRLFLPLLVCALLMVSGVVWMGSRAFQAQQLSLTRSTALTVDNYLNEALRVLEVLSLRNETASQAEMELSMEVAKRGYAYFETFYYLGLDGRVLAAIPDGERYRGLDMSHQTYYQSAINSKGTVITRPFISVRNGQPAVYLARTIPGQGVIAVELNLGELQRIVSTGGLTGGSQVFITDRSGIVLAHPQQELVAQQAYLGSLPLLRQTHDQPTSLYYWDNDTLMFGGAARIETTDWVVASQSPVSAVFAPLLAPTLAFLLLSLVTQILFISMFGKKFEQVVSNPLGKLSQVTSQVASGSYAVNKQVENIPHTFQEISALAGNFSNMAESVLQREKMFQHLATHDPLTNLPNRELIHKTLIDLIEASRAGQSDDQSDGGQPIAVLFIDLDDFKSINDAFGHHIGDLALQVVAGYLINNTRANDCVGRLGGDEFAVILEGVRTASNASSVAKHILHALNRPMYIENHEIYTSCSLGISMYPQDGTDPDVLIQNADTAMYKAKHEGKNNFQFYSQEMETQAHERHRLSSYLHHALENNELEVYYQPIYSAGTHAITGSEALLRWTNPQLGFVYPDRFIPLAIETGLILPIGEWVLRQSCAENQRWVLQGYGQQRINVNIAERQLKQADFVEVVKRVLDETGLPPYLLNLELTENIFFGTPQHIREVNTLLMDVKRLGVMLSLDDFGTGKGTLSLLTQIPFDEIKIDRMLSCNVLSDTRSAVIVSGIVQMARGLGKKVVAEGVETIGQLAFFEALGVDMLQGYYFSKALPRAQFDQLLPATPAQLVLPEVKSVE